MSSFDEFDHQCRNRWPSILLQVGIPHSALSGRDVPCPMCKGKDRFSFNNRDGDGSWFCRKCGHGRGGVSLVMAFLGVNFVEAKRRVMDVLGLSRVDAPRKSRPMSGRAAEALARLWAYAKPLSGDDPPSCYLASRALAVTPSPEAVRYVEQMRDSNPEEHTVAHRPAMVSRFVAPDAKSDTLHATYLTLDGQKAATRLVKRFASGSTVPTGGAVRLMELSDASDGVLGVAEGIETALAAAELFDMPVWAALSSGGMLRFEPPPEVRRLHIFGDRDHNFEGQMSAYSLARKLADKRPNIEVSVRLTREDSGAKDWNDFLRLEKAVTEAGSNVVKLK